jgi:hypothetical protein
MQNGQIALPGKAVGSKKFSRDRCLSRHTASVRRNRNAHHHRDA